MGKLMLFNFITLNGFFQGAQGDISWHKQGGGEDEAEYSKKGVQAGSILLFGRRTYEMMAGFWPSEQAKQMAPEMAAGMNKAEKIVFSNTLKKANWENSRISNDPINDIKTLKKDSEKDLTILGSGTIVTQLAEAGLIDHYELMMDPVALGEGTPIFKNMKTNLHLKLVNSIVFKSGTIVLSYQPK